jgi:hypothetical protein
MEPLIEVNVTVDQITQGYRLLRRFDLNTEKLTECTVISNQKEIPDSTASIRYEALPLDSFVGEKVDGWDGHSSMILYFNDQGVFDHWEKAATAAAGA